MAKKPKTEQSNDLAQEEAKNSEGQGKAENVAKEQQANSDAAGAKESAPIDRWPKGDAGQANERGIDPGTAIIPVEGGILHAFIETPDGNRALTADEVASIEAIFGNIDNGGVEPIAPTDGSADVVSHHHVSTFGWAVDHLKAGHAIKRASWIGHKAVDLKHHNPRIILDHEDIVATDWVLA